MCMLFILHTSCIVINCISLLSRCKAHSCHDKQIAVASSNLSDPRCTLKYYSSLLWEGCSVDLDCWVLAGLQQIVTNFQKTAEGVSGPVAIVAVGSQIARSDLSGLFQFAAIVNINLAVVNALPLPALDGGFLALLLAEAVRGVSYYYSASALHQHITFASLMWKQAFHAQHRSMYMFILLCAFCCGICACVSQLWSSERCKLVAPFNNMCAAQSCMPCGIKSACMFTVMVSGMDLAFLLV